MSRKREHVPHHTRLSDVTEEPIEHLVEGFVPIGATTLVEGSPGSGKSTMTLDLAARLTIGAVLPGSPARPAMDVVIVNPEDPGPVILKRVEAAGGDPARFRLIYEPGSDTNRSVDLSRDREFLRDCYLADPDVGLMVVESIALALGPGGRTEFGTRDAMHNLSRDAEVTSTAVIAIRHLRKGGGAAIHRGSGFVAIPGSARSVTSLSEDPDDPDALIWESVKANLSAPPLAHLLRIIETDHGPRVEWTGTTERSASRAVRTTPSPKLDAACALLLGLLRDGPRRWTDIQQAAHEAGISDRTMDTAKATLGIASEQIPEPGTQGRGPSWWSLPSASEATEPPTDDTTPEEH